MRSNIWLSLLLFGLSLASTEGCRRRLLSVGEKCKAGEANCLCDTSGDCRITASDGSGAGGPGGKCVPTTCAAQGATCGEIPDTCGRTLRCGSCEAPLVCDLTTHTCGDCRPTTCAAKNKQCGTVSDGCGGLLNCDAEAGGGCSGTQTCGGAGVPNECGCTPKTCAELGATCGQRDDGCGGTVDCDVQVGGCPPGQNCDPGTNSCFVPNCTPKTCTELGNPCGPVSDGCGRTITCPAGKCSASGQICDPESHQCTTYDPNNGQLGKGTLACGDRQCGAFQDACHVDHTCGGAAENGNCGGGGQPACPCTPGQVCRGNLCKSCSALTTCPPGTCGAVSNGCGGVLDCGTTSAAGANGGGKCDVRGQVCDDILTRCVDPRPTNCAAEGKNCGYIFDGQGNQIFCGNCTAPETCGGDGRGGVCGLKPGIKACLDANAVCGQVQDSCGNPYLCGTCATDNRCTGDNSCVACVPEDYRTCEQIQVPAQPRKCGSLLDHNCGRFDLNCDCSSVGPRYSCSTSAPNTIGDCICSPNVTCTTANACNTTLPDDGCGFPVNCGACSGGRDCNEANKTCCAANAPYNADTGACCNAGATVNGTAPNRICCDSGHLYNSDANVCCGVGEVLNGSSGSRICCIANRYNPTNNTCCAGEYNDVTASCCPAGQVEISGICCNPGQFAVGGICCGAANDHNVGGSCCPDNRFLDASGTCCPAGQHTSGTPEFCCGANLDSSGPTADGNRLCCASGQTSYDLPGAPTTDAMCCTTGQTPMRPWNNPAGAAICCGAGQVNNGGACCNNTCGNNTNGQCGGSVCGGATACPDTRCASGNVCGSGNNGTTACCNQVPATDVCCVPSCGNRCNLVSTVSDGCGGTVSGCNCGGNPTRCNSSTATCCGAGTPNPIGNICCANATDHNVAGSCCPDARYNTTSGACCGTSTPNPIGAICCANATDHNVGGSCCPDARYNTTSGACCGTSTPNPIGAICCANSNDHNVGGTCCPDARYNPNSGGSCCAGPYNSTSNSCCAAGQHASGSICCGPGTDNTGGICCAPGQHNSGGICCGPGTDNVGGICCAAGQVNFGGSCCTPPTDAVDCTSTSQSTGVCNTTVTRCGTTITCDGDCPPGNTCVNNACCGNNVCGARICGGPYTNACGNSTPVCGTCPAQTACTASGTCCKALTCAATGHQCGLDSDGCGGQVACGTCPANKVCGNYGSNVQKCCTAIDPANNQVCPCGTQKLDTCTGNIVNCNGCGSTGG